MRLIRQEVLIMSFGGFLMASTIGTNALGNF